MRGSTNSAGQATEGHVRGDQRIVADISLLVADTLGLSPKALTPQTPLLGHMVELDSMTVVAIITALEERYGFVVQDDELSASVFDSVESLARFVAQKLPP